MITYTAFVSACEMGKQAELALEVFEATRRQAMLPNIMFYNALISLCEKGKRPLRALEVFQAMRRQGMVPEVIEIAPRDRRTLMAPAIYSSKLPAAVRHNS